MEQSTLDNDRSSDSIKWIEAARDGSNEALGRLMEASRRYLLLVANRELRPELRAKGGASDIVQETFLEAQRDFPRFEGTSEAELMAWLRRLLLNNLSNFSRKFRDTNKRQVGREISLEAKESSDSSPGLNLRADIQSPSQFAMADEESRALLDALDRLPEHYRQVILLRHREGQSYNEIAEVVGRSPEAVRKLWSRAVELLQQELEPPDDQR